MRLIYFYSRWPEEAWHHSPIEEARGQGWLYLWQRLIEEGVLDEVRYYIESARYAGTYDYGNGVTCLASPDVEDIQREIKVDDIICLVCGYRSWEALAYELEARGHWIMLYRAGWHRHRWAVFQIELLDLIKTHDWYEKGQRLLYALPKPIHPLRFRPLKRKREYDICIGASTRWSKKGQWKFIKMMAAYKQLFGDDLRAVFPGAARGDQWVHEYMQSTIRDCELMVTELGRQPLSAMPYIYNASHTLAHAALGKQNDRARLEAMRCGCPLIVSDSNKHAWFTYDNPRVSLVCPELAGTYKNETGLTDEQAESMAQRVHDWLPLALQAGRRKEVFDYYEQHASVENVILPRAIELFGWLKEHPRADRQALKERWTPDGPTGQIDQSKYRSLSWQG